MFRRSMREKSKSNAARASSAGPRTDDNASVRSRVSFSSLSRRSRSSSTSSRADASASFSKSGTKLIGTLALELAVQLPVVPTKATRASLQKAVVNRTADLESIARKKRDKINKRDAGNRKAAIHYCAALGNLDALRVLLKVAGPFLISLPMATGLPGTLDIDLVDGEGRTALHLAVLSGNLNFVRELLQARANVNILDTCGYTPLHYAVYANSLPILHNLLERNADLAVVDIHIHAPYLHHAVQYNYKDVINALLQHNHNIDAVDVSNRTALHIACLSDKPDNGIIRLLCNNHANPLSVDSNGLSAIQSLTLWHENTELTATLSPTEQEDAQHLLEFVTRKTIEIEARGGKAQSPRKSFCVPTTDTTKQHNDSPDKLNENSSLMIIHEKTAIETFDEDIEEPNTTAAIPFISSITDKNTKDIDYATLMDDVSMSDISVNISDSGDNDNMPDIIAPQTQSNTTAHVDPEGSVVSFNVSEDSDHENDYNINNQESDRDDDVDSLSDILQLERDNDGKQSLPVPNTQPISNLPTATTLSHSSLSEAINLPVKQIEQNHSLQTSQQNQLPSHSSSPDLLSLVGPGSQDDTDADHSYIADDFDLEDNDDDVHEDINLPESAVSLIKVEPPITIATPSTKAVIKSDGIEKSEHSDGILSLCASDEDHLDSEDVSELSESVLNALTNTLEFEKNITTASAKLNNSQPPLNASVQEKRLFEHAPSSSHEKPALTKQLKDQPLPNLLSESRNGENRPLYLKTKLEKPVTELTSAIDEGIMTTPLEIIRGENSKTLAKTVQTNDEKQLSVNPLQKHEVKYQMQFANSIKTIPLSSTIDDKSAILISKNSEIQVLHQRIKQMEEMAVEDCQDKKLQLEERDRELKATEIALANSKAQTLAILQELNTVKATNASLEQKLIKQERQQKEIEAKEQEERAKRKLLQEQLQDLKQHSISPNTKDAANEALRAQIEEHNNQFQELEQQLYRTQALHEETIMQHQRMQVEQEDLMRTRVEQIDFLSNQIHAFTARISRTASRVASRSVSPSKAHLNTYDDSDDDEELARSTYAARHGKQNIVRSDLLVSKLQLASASTQQLHADVEEMEQAMSRYEHFYVDALTARQTLIESLQTQLDVTRCDLEDLLNEHQNAQYQLVMLKQQVTTSNMTIDSLSTGKHELQEKLSQIEEEYEKYRTQTKGEHELLPPKLTQLRQSEEDLQKTMVSDSNELDKGMHLHSVLDLKVSQDKLSAAHAEYRELKFEKEQVERSLNSRITSLQAELVQLRTPVEILKTSSSTEQEQPVSTKITTSSARHHINQELELIRQELNRSHQTVSDLRQKLNEAETARKNDQSTIVKEREQERYQAVAAVNNEQTLSLERRVLALQREIVEMSSQIDTLKFSLEEQTGIAVRYQEKSEYLEKVVANLRAEKEATRNVLDEKEAELQQRVSDQDIMAAQFKTTSLAGVTTNKLLEQKFSQYEIRINELQEQISGLHQTRDALEVMNRLKVQKLQQRLDDLLSEKEELQNTLSFGNRDTQILHMELSRKTAENEEVADQLRKVHRLVGELKMQLSEERDKAGESHVELLSLRELRTQEQKHIEELQNSYNKIIDERKQGHLELLECEDRIIILSTRVEESMQELQKAREHVRAQQERIAQLSQRIEQEMSAKARLQTVLDEAGPRLETIHGQKTSLQNERGDWLELSKNLVAEIDRYAAHFKLMEGEFNSKLDMSEMKNEKLRSTITHEKATIFKLRQENQELHRVLLAYQYNLPLSRGNTVSTTYKNINSAVQPQTGRTTSPIKPISSVRGSSGDKKIEEVEPIIKRLSSNDKTELGTNVDNQASIQHNNAVLEMKLKAMVSRVENVDNSLTNLQSKLGSTEFATSQAPNPRFWI